MIIRTRFTSKNYYNLGFVMERGHHLTWKQSLVGAKKDVEEDRISREVKRCFLAFCIMA